MERHCLTADLVIGSVLVPGATAPRLVSRDLVGRMQPGAVLVDVAIDQAVLPPPDRRPMRIPSIGSVRCCTIAWPTCRAPCPVPLPLP